MNKIYTLVWNHATGSWNVAREGARRRGKAAGGKRFAATALSLLGLAAMGPACALPVGQAIVAGQGDISTSADGRNMSINQQSDKLVTNWTDFSVGQGERVSFHQPTSQSIALNRVIGNNGSSIQGSIDANGRVFIVNPNGVMFAKGSQVNVGGLVASTRNISDADFLAGNYRFNGTSSNAVVNDGTITAAQGGSVALLGAKVSNNGVIQAQMGRVALGAGNDLTINFDGNGLLNLQVNGAAVGALASNGGLIQADGGQVLMSARAAGALLDTVVNNEGTIAAKGLQNQAGRVVLDGGDAGLVRVAGTLDASAPAGGQGGTIGTSGQRVEVARGAKVNTLSSQGRTGNWQIASADATVDPDGGTIAADTLSRNLDSTNVELTGTRGNVSMRGPVNWTSGNSLTLVSAQGDLNMNAALRATGANAAVSLSAANGGIMLNDQIALTGNGANLQLNSGSNGYALNNGAAVTLSGNAAAFRANGEDYKVVQNVDQLRSIGSNLNGRYVLGNKISGDGRTVNTIGGDATFLGVMDGLGNTISGLSVQGSGAYVGLFGANAGRIQNMNLVSTTVSGAASTANNTSIGALVGLNAVGGILSNVHATDITVKAGASRTNFVGGLAGVNLSGAIDRSSVSGSVLGNQYTASAGGLVGENITSADPRYAIAKISGSSADVTLTAPMVAAWGSYGAGGLVGANRGGLITASSSRGSVTVTSSGTNAGGLVGINANSGSNNGRIEASSSSVRTVGSGNSNVGGVAGLNDGGSIANSSASGETVGRGSAAVGGLVGSNGGTLVNVSASGAVSDLTGANVGGLVGRNTGAIGTATAIGDVTGGSGSFVGGLAGRNEGTIQAASARGKSTGGADSRVGGLVASNAGTVTDSIAAGNVYTGTNGYGGGFVAVNDWQGSGEIRQSLASGNVVGQKGSVVGGFAAKNDRTIVAASSSGSVSAETDSILGSLIGINNGTVSSSTTSGKLIFAANSNVQYGALAGVNMGVMRGNDTSGEAAAIRRVGVNRGVIQ